MRLGDRAGGTVTPQEPQPLHPCCTPGSWEGGTGVVWMQLPSGAALAAPRALPWGHHNWDTQKKTKGHLTPKLGTLRPPGHPKLGTQPLLDVQNQAPQSHAVTPSCAPWGHTELCQGSSEAVMAAPSCGQICSAGGHQDGPLGGLPPFLGFPWLQAAWLSGRFWKRGEMPLFGHFTRGHPCSTGGRPAWLGGGMRTQG